MANMSMFGQSSTARQSTLAEDLPALAYPAMRNNNRVLVMTNVAPTAATLYQDGITMVEFSLPGGFSHCPSLIPSVQQEVYLRFYNSVSRQQDSISGVSVAMSFNRTETGGNSATTSVIFSGIGSRDKVLGIIKFLADQNRAVGVDRTTEQVSVKNTSGEVIGIATGPTNIKISNSNTVRAMMESVDPIDKYVHDLTKEMVAYFSRACESADAFKKLLDVFGLERIVEGLRDAEINERSAAIIKAEEARVAAVLASMSRRRVIRIRRAD